MLSTMNQVQIELMSPDLMEDTSKPLITMARYFVVRDTEIGIRWIGKCKKCNLGKYYYFDKNHCGPCHETSWTHDHG